MSSCLSLKSKKENAFGVEKRTNPYNLFTTKKVSSDNFLTINGPHHYFCLVDSPLTLLVNTESPYQYMQGTGRDTYSLTPLGVVAAINLLCLTRADTCPLRSSTSPSPPFGFRFRKRNGRLFLIRLVIQNLPFQLHNSFLFLFIILIIFRFVLFC